MIVRSNDDIFMSALEIGKKTEVGGEFYAFTELLPVPSLMTFASTLSSVLGRVTVLKGGESDFLIRLLKRVFSYDRFAQLMDRLVGKRLDERELAEVIEALIEGRLEELVDRYGHKVFLAPLGALGSVRVVNTVDKSGRKYTNLVLVPPAYKVMPLTFPTELNVEIKGERIQGWLTGEPLPPAEEAERYGMDLVPSFLGVRVRVKASVSGFSIATCGRDEIVVTDNYLYICKEMLEDVKDGVLIYGYLVDFEESNGKYEPILTVLWGSGGERDKTLFPVDVDASLGLLRDLKVDTAPTERVIRIMEKYDMLYVP